MNNEGVSGRPPLDLPVLEDTKHEKKRKRKRKDDEGDIEDAYMQRLALEEEKDARVAAMERAIKRQKASMEDEEPNGPGEQGLGSNSEVEVETDVDEDVTKDNEDEDVMSPPPKHETEEAVDTELSKANRTVFLGNVSTAAITSSSSRRTLTDHLKTIFRTVSDPRQGEPKHSVESLRFRSTPYATAVPKKAAFARKEVMDATTKSTNAYAVFSNPALVREATKRLNGTIVLGRHLRVDSVAHPTPVDHRRCVFVGGLAFVDDESSIQAANEEEGKEKRKPNKQPADVEEGLWRAFGKCGTVESVRVIRDSTTRVGKGIAYVQLDDANAVEAALLYDGQKFPPLLPRKLRVSRAKAQKRNVKPGSDRPGSKPNTNGYQRKISSEEASKMGRAKKMFGRAAAANIQRPAGRSDGTRQLEKDLRKPEAFVFEGHRATSKSGKSGMKLAGKGKKKSGKPSDRSAKRGAAYKASKRQK